MPAPTSRIERFVNLIGGEQNLPPKLPVPPAPIEQVSLNGGDAGEEGESHSHDLPQVPAVDHTTGPNKATREASATTGSQGQEPLTDHANSQPNFQPLPTDPRLGEPAPLGIDFAPFGAVTKYCYKFVKKEFQQILATAFFDAGKIFERDWDLYYVWSDHFYTARPTVFVPEHQLQALLDEINRSYPEVGAAITDELREEGLVVSFDGLPSELRPRWLGHSTSRAQYNSWTDSLPSPKSTSGAMLEARSLEAFKAKMELAIEVAKNRSKAKRKVNHAQAVVKRQEMTRQALRAQRYLGLLPKNEENLIAGMDALSISAIDANSPPPFPLDMDVIFIAIDLEAYERPPRPITEVGVATLDTRDLLNQAPGSVGKKWQQHIRARHFRILEHKHLKNSEFVNGCPEAFEFGTSEFVGKDSIASKLSSCFHSPFSRDPAPEGKSSADEEEEEKRNIVLLGHDINQDIAYMHQLGFSVLNRGNLLEAMDTAIMFRSYSQDPNPTSLGKILYHFELEGWNPHNAGNDAVHTMWAMLAICVKMAAERETDAEVKRRDEQVAKQREAAVELARERAAENAEGWTQELGEDGGEAVSPTQDANEWRVDGGGKPVYGPPRPPKLPEGFGGLWTSGGAPLDV